MLSGRRTICHTCPRLGSGFNKNAFYLVNCQELEVMYRAYSTLRFIRQQQRVDFMVFGIQACIQVISNNIVYYFILFHSQNHFAYNTYLPYLIQFLIVGMLHPISINNCHTYNYIMSFFSRLMGLIPRPFRYLQRKLDIQAEWQQFKLNIRPHRYKITAGLLFVLYPLYSSYLNQAVQLTKRHIGKIIQQQTEPSQPAFQWTQNFIKHLLQHVFTDPRVKEEAMDFLFAILKDQKFYNSLLTLLVSALKSESFMNELKLAVKQILIDELKDPEVNSSINDFLIGLSKNENIKNAFIKLIQQVFSSKESENTIVSLLKKGITNQEVKEALGESVNFAVRQVLSDEETLNQLKIFIFFLLRRFETDDQIKGMMDILFAKGLGLVKKKKDPELDKFLRPKKADMV